MTNTQPQPVAGASTWTGPAMTTNQEWLEPLTGPEVNELENALAHIKSHSIPLLEITQADFLLPYLGPRLKTILEDVQHRRGFSVLRGMPVDKYSQEETEIILWGIGTYFGKTISQNSNGDLMGYVYDHGVHMHTARVRGYMTPDHLRFHSDRCDLVALACIRKAKEGGLSRLVSMTAIHNEILSRRPDLLKPFYNGFMYVVSELSGDTKPVRVPSYSLTAVSYTHLTLPPNREV